MNQCSVRVGARVVNEAKVVSTGNTLAIAPQDDPSFQGLAQIAGKAR
jgi:hypothetical protein